MREKRSAGAPRSFSRGREVAGKELGLLSRLCTSLKLCGQSIGSTRARLSCRRAGARGSRDTHRSRRLTRGARRGRLVARASHLAPARLHSRRSICAQFTAKIACASRSSAQNTQHSTTRCLLSARRRRRRAPTAARRSPQMRALAFSASVASSCTRSSGALVPCAAAATRVRVRRAIVCSRVRGRASARACVHWAKRMHERLDY